MLQTLLVCVIVLVAAVSAAWRLAGTMSRVRLLEALLRQLPGKGKWHGLVSRMAQKQRALLVSGSCAACSAHAPNKKPRA